jgi:protein phosphatase 1 regulatory subunit 11
MLLPPTERRESGAIIPSASQTQTNAQPSIPRPVRVPDGTLRLRGGPVEDRRVRWGADVIDNEGLGRKKSKGLLLNSLDSWSFDY